MLIAHKVFGKNLIFLNYHTTARNRAAISLGARERLTFLLPLGVRNKTLHDFICHLGSGHHHTSVLPITVIKA